MGKFTIADNTLTLTDNTYDCVGEVVASQQVEALRYLAALSRQSLQSAGLLIFPAAADSVPEDPKEDGDYLSGVHSSNNKPILSVQHLQDNTYSINTGNLVGFIGCGDLKIIIQSRFATENGDFWLHYLMQQVLRLNVVDLPITPSPVERILNLLPLLFPSYLVRALNQGIFKQYQRFHYNDSKPRGTLEVARHLKANVPFQGNVAYSTREFSCDNPVTELIRHTIEFIKTKPHWAPLLDLNADVTEAVQQIELVTPCFARSALPAVLTANHCQCAHPLLTDYVPLQQLCLKILRHEDEGLRFSTDKEQVYGVLFDISYLWEEYLALQLQPLGFAHQSNAQRQFWPLAKSGSGDSQLLFCPDFVLNPSSEALHGNEPPTTSLVADAKYKRYEDKIPDNEDVFQMLRYMYALRAEHSLLLSPASRENPKESHYDFSGYGGTLDVRFLAVPQQTASYQDFCAKMQGAEESFSMTIRDFLQSIDQQ